MCRKASAGAVRFSEVITLRVMNVHHAERDDYTVLFTRLLPSPLGEEGKNDPSPPTRRERSKSANSSQAGL